MESRFVFSACLISVLASWGGCTRNAASKRVSSAVTPLAQGTSAVPLPETRTPVPTNSPAPPLSPTLAPREPTSVPSWKKWETSVRASPSTVPAVDVGTAREPSLALEAEAATASPGISILDSYRASGGRYVKPAAVGDSLIFPEVDFGTGKYSRIQLRVSTPREGAKIEVHLEGVSGPLVAEVAIPSLGSWTRRNGVEWSSGLGNVSARLAPIPEGKHALALVFRGELAELDLMALFPEPRAKTFHVNPEGMDTASGASDAPLRTISQGISLLAPGDTLVVHKGIYNERITMGARKSGLEDAHVTIMAAPGEEVVIDGSGLPIPEYDGLVVMDADDVTFSGFTLRNTGAVGFLNRGDRVRFLRNRVHGVAQSGVTSMNAVDSEFAGNEIFDTVRMNYPYGQREGGWGSALSTGESLRTKFWDNRVHDNHGEGIIVGLDTPDAVVAGNASYDNFSVQIYLDTSRNALVENNLVYLTATEYVAPHARADWLKLANGISVANEDYAFWGGANWYRCDNPDYRLGGGHVIRNNVVVNVRNGFTYYHYISCSGLVNVSFVNNTVAAAWESPVLISEGGHAGTRFVSNVFHSKGSLALNAPGIGDVEFLSNSFFATAANPLFAFVWKIPGQALRTTGLEEWAQAMFGNTRNLWGDPLFVAPGDVSGDVAAHHSLRTGSPLLGKGHETLSAPSAYGGGARPLPAGSQPDMGAHELP